MCVALQPPDDLDHGFYVIFFDFKILIADKGENQPGILFNPFSRNELDYDEVRRSTIYLFDRTRNQRSYYVTFGLFSLRIEPGQARLLGCSDAGSLHSTQELIYGTGRGACDKCVSTDKKPLKRNHHKVAKLSLGRESETIRVKDKGLKEYLHN